jgi:hypothetical protein
VSESGPRGYGPEVTLVAVTSLLFAALVFGGPYIPGLDMPWHTLTSHLLAHSGAEDFGPRFAGFFVRLYMLPANMSYYFVSAWMTKLTGSVLIATQILVAIYVIGFVWSTWLLLRAFGGSGVLAVLAAPAAYSGALEFGFVTFSLTYPLIILLWALSRRAACAERLSAANIVGIGTLSLIVSFTHPFAAALALIGVAVVTVIDMDRSNARRRLAIVATAVVATFPMVVSLVTLARDGASQSSWQPALMRNAGLWDKMTSHQYTALDESLAAAPVRLFGYLPPVWRFVIATAGLMSATLAHRLPSGGHVRSTGARVAWWLVVILALLYLVTPYQFMWPYRWFGAQPRVLPLLWIAGLVVCRVAPGASWRHAIGPFTVALTALTVLYSAGLHPFQVESRDFRAVVEAGASRTTTLALIEQPPHSDHGPRSPFRHFSSYAIVERDGYSSHLPHAERGTGNAGKLIPVVVAADAPDLAVPQLGYSRTFDWTKHSDGWNQFLIRDIDTEQRFDYFREHSSEVELLSQHGRWRLYRRR